MGLDTNFGTLHQDGPTEDENSKSVTDLVIQDLKDRREGGVEKYGKELLTHNGRDPLIDLYQELVDAVVYLRQALQERKDDDRVHISLTQVDARRVARDLDDLETKKDVPIGSVLEEFRDLVKDKLK